MTGQTDRMSDVTLRPATLDDATALAGLRWEWTHGVGVAGGERFAGDMHAWLAAHADTHRPVLAERDGVAVGMSWLALTPRPPVPDALDRRSGDLQSVYVTPSERGRGLGARLVRRVIDDARAAGVTFLTVHARPESAAFYGTVGFETHETLQILRF